MGDKPILAYWNLRGRAGHLRMLLTHLGVEFEDRQLVLGEFPEYPGWGEWMAAKPALGIAYPNLPYYIDDDVQITETPAITRAICQKYKPEYLGRTLTEQAACHEFYQVTHETRMNGVYAKLGGADYEAKMSEVKDCIANWVAAFSKVRGPNRFTLGNQPTYVDFYVDELISWYMLVDEELAEKVPALVEFQNNMRELPGVADYHTSAAGLKFSPRILAWANARAEAGKPY